VGSASASARTGRGVLLVWGGGGGSSCVGKVTSPSKGPSKRPTVGQSSSACRLKGIPSARNDAGTATPRLLLRELLRVLHSQKKW